MKLAWGTIFSLTYKSALTPKPRDRGWTLRDSSVDSSKLAFRNLPFQGYKHSEDPVTDTS